MRVTWSVPKYMSGHCWRARKIHRIAGRQIRSISRVTTSSTFFMFVRSTAESDYGKAVELLLYTLTINSVEKALNKTDPLTAKVYCFNCFSLRYKDSW